MTVAALTRNVLHPVHAVLLCSILPLFFGAMLSDWAYTNSFQVQWVNFASWLIAGALVLNGFALLWAAIDFLRSDIVRTRRRALYVLLLSTTFIVGFINALTHAKDGWASMPAGLVLSIVVFALALASVWAGFSSTRSGDAR